MKNKQNKQNIWVLKKTFIKKKDFMANLKCWNDLMCYWKTMNICFCILIKQHDLVWAGDHKVYVKEQNKNKCFISCISLAFLSYYVHMTCFFIQLLPSISHYPFFFFVIQMTTALIHSLWKIQDEWIRAVKIH